MLTATEKQNSKKKKWGVVVEFSDLFCFCFCLLGREELDRMRG